MEAELKDIISLPWLGKHQFFLNVAYEQNLWHRVREEFDHVILYANNGSMCQPFHLVSREVLKTLVPVMAYRMDQFDDDVPPISKEFRKRSFKVNSTHDHVLASVITEAQLFAVLDAGGNDFFKFVKKKSFPFAYDFFAWQLIFLQSMKYLGKRV